MSYDILILGGGVAGLTTAMALSKFAPANIKLKIDVFELRPEPSTVGGAINLTPNALRLLDFLGVYAIIRERCYGITVDAVEVFSIYSVKKLAESSFRGPDGNGIGKPPYKARQLHLTPTHRAYFLSVQAIRITRANLMRALIATLQQYTNINLHLEHRCTDISQSSSDSSITATFSNNTSHTGSLLLGCDGVHSYARISYVSPTDKQIYTGVSNAFGFLPLTDYDREHAHFEISSLNFSRSGLLLASYHEASKSEGYVGAIVPVDNVGSREMWKVKGSDADGVKKEMVRRFATDETALPCVREWVMRIEGWFMWPVYMVPNNARGPWSRGRTMLIGDAAHAMRKSFQSLRKLVSVHEAGGNAGISALHSGQAGTAMYQSTKNYDLIKRPQTKEYFGSFRLRARALPQEACPNPNRTLTRDLAPQGESTGIVLEDGVLFARCLWSKLSQADQSRLISQKPNNRPTEEAQLLQEALQAYENLRRPRIEAAFKESMAVVHSASETSKFGFWLKTCIIPVFLLISKKKRMAHFEEDVTICSLGFDVKPGGGLAGTRMVPVAQSARRSIAGSGSAIWSLWTLFRESIVHIRKRVLKSILKVD